MNLRAKVGSCQSQGKAGKAVRHGPSKHWATKSEVSSGESVTVTGSGPNAGETTEGAGDTKADSGLFRGLPRGTGVVVHLSSIGLKFTSANFKGDLYITFFSMQRGQGAPSG